VPRRPPLSRPALGIIAAAAGGAALTGCGGPGAASVTPPTPSASATSTCARLVAALPHRVADRHDRRDVTPASPYTAAWGDPAITLQCGVRPPNRPLSGDELTVGRVTWLANREGDVVTWVSLGRRVTVELDVPAGYDDQDAVVADVSAVVARADAAV
jgi:hypothetical protein